MSVTWQTLRVATNRIEIIECYPTLDDCIREMALLAWEEPSNAWFDFVTDDESGEVVATGIFGPGLELLVTCADGRKLTFEMPESYSRMD
jgi:hypothetical protein